MYVSTKDAFRSYVLDQEIAINIRFRPVEYLWQEKSVGVEALNLGRYPRKNKRLWIVERDGVSYAAAGPVYFNIQ